MNGIHLNKNTFISFAIITSIVFSPVILIPKKTNAQSMGAYAATPGAIATILPLCQDFIGDVGSSISGLFSSKKTDAIANIQAATDPSAGKLSVPSPNELTGGKKSTKEAASTGLATTRNTVLSLENAVPVNLGPETIQDIKDTKKDTEEIKKNVEKDSASYRCLSGVAKTLIRITYQRITLATIEWINSGMNGKPAFMTEPGGFWKEIRNREFLSFGYDISDPESFPFGKKWLRKQAVALNKQFKNNAKYSLDELTKRSYPDFKSQEFYADFSHGGWNAWLNMTQNPYNNPLGFDIHASEELSKLLTGTDKSAGEVLQDSLNQSGGFFGDERCVNPKGLTRQEDLKAKKEGTGDICTKWEYVTPGKLIAEKATKIGDYDLDMLWMSADDFNSAMGALTDSLLAHYSQKYIDEGFVDFTKSIDPNAIYTGGYILEPSQTEKDFNFSYLSNSWLKSNPDFNIRKDLTQALVDEQRTYLNKIKEQNKELLYVNGGNYKFTNGVSNATGLIPTIYQLDYCIPGPHPGWENDSRESLNAVLETIVPQTAANLEKVTEYDMYQMAKSMSATITTSIINYKNGELLGKTLSAFSGPIGILAGFGVQALIESIWGDNNPSPATKLLAYYGGLILGMTGMLPDVKNATDSTIVNYTTKYGVSQGMHTLLTRYGFIMKLTYENQKSYTPQLWNLKFESNTKFEEVTGYHFMLDKNKEKVGKMEKTIKDLVEIKTFIDNLNIQLENQSMNLDEYETQLVPYRAKFERVSNEMVNGADIAVVDSLNKQIIEEKDYIYNYLLKGEDGCEKLMESPQPPFPYPWNGTHKYSDGFDVRSVLRAVYPIQLPILYDYQSFDIVKPAVDYSLRATYPDPLNRNLTTKVPYADDVNYVKKGSNYCRDTQLISNGCRFREREFGPGFLSFVYWSAGYVKDDNKSTAENNDWYEHVRGPQRLHIHDIFGIKEEQETRYSSVGQKRKKTSHDTGGVFETIIGIY